MDPDANLREQVALAKQIIKDTDDGVVYDDATVHPGVRLAELVVALNQWRFRGGFTPEAVMS